MDKNFCQNPKNLILGTFKPSKPSPLKLFANIDIRHLLYDVKLHGKRKRKNK